MSVTVMHQGRAVQFNDLAAAKAFMQERGHAAAKPAGDRPKAAPTQPVRWEKADCPRCFGTGTYRWSKCVGGVPVVCEGTCFRCGGSKVVNVKVTDDDQQDALWARDHALAQEVALDLPPTRYVSANTIRLNRWAALVQLRAQHTGVPVTYSRRAGCAVCPF